MMSQNAHTNQSIGNQLNMQFVDIKLIKMRRNIDQFFGTPSFTKIELRGFDTKSSIYIANFYFLVCFFKIFVHFVWYFRQNSRLWESVNNMNDLNEMIRMWDITLDKQGCATMLQAGSIIVYCYLFIYTTCIAHYSRMYKSRFSCSLGSLARLSTLL